LNINESAIAHTGVGVEIINLIQCACGSADGKLSLVIVGGNAISAHSFHEVEIFQANAYSVFDFLVDGADERSGDRLYWRQVGESAFSIQKDIALCTDAGGGG
jgi:hypothetical protein